MTLTEKQKYEIIILHEKEYTNLSIATELKINRHTVRRWISRYNNTNTVERQIGSGRNKKTTEKEDKKMVQILKENNFFTSIDIKNRLENEGINVSERTIQNRIKEKGYTYNKPPQQPLLTEKHKKDRVKWAQNNLETNWKMILFSDETYINKMSNGQFRWHNKNDINDVDFVVKHPLKINIWGCIKFNGPNRIHIFEGIMDAEKYMEILNSNIVKNNDIIYQDDNDPRHRSYLIKEWKKECNITEYNWPSNSPDLNPMENIWNMLKIKVNKVENKTINDLIKCTEDKWNEIDKEVINNIIEGMPKRILKVIENNGNYIHY